MKNTPYTKAQVKALDQGFHASKFSNRKSRRSHFQKDRFKSGMIISGTLKFKQYTQVIECLNRDTMKFELKKINHTVAVN